MLADFYRIKWNLDEKRTSPFTGTESPHVCMSLFPVGVRTGKKKEHHVSQMEPTRSSQMLDSNFTLDICCYSLSFCLQYRCPKSKRTGDDADGWGSEALEPREGSCLEIPGTKTAEAVAAVRGQASGSLQGGWGLQAQINGYRS